MPHVGRTLPIVDDGFEHWVATNVRAQKQPGYMLVTVTVPLGDLTGEQMRLLGDLAEAFADGTVRTTQNQDVLLRWVPKSAVLPLYRRLVAANLGLGDANTPADVAGCPGAESCKLAVTQSRGLGRLLSSHLQERPDLVRGRAGTVDQDQRVSERLRSASHRRHRLSGQRPQGGLARRSPVLPDGGRRLRRRRRAVRSPRRENSGAPRAGGRRAARRPVRTRGARRGVSPTRSSAASISARLHALVADLEEFDPAEAKPEDYDRSRRGARVQPRCPGG